MAKPGKNFKGGLKISDDFSTFVPPMAKQDFNLLLQNIKHDGYIRDPLVVWNDVILDGHHRYKIAEMLDLDFKIKKMEFKSDVEAKLWIAKNQTGQRRLSKSQLAVFALKMLPMFTEIGKQKQSEGGKLKGKGKKEKAFNANDEAASMARVGVNMLKDIKAINNEVAYKPMVEMIRQEMYDKLSVKQAKSLIKRHRRGDFPLMFTETSELTDEAIKALNLIRDPEKKPKTTTTTLDSSDDSSSDDSSSDSKGGGGGAEIQDSNENSPTDDGTSQGKPNVETVMEESRLKRYVQETKEKIQEAFKGKVSAISILENPENMVMEITNIVIKENLGAPKDDNYHSDKVLIVPTNETHCTWYQMSSSVAALSCDSSEFPVRLLYFGSKEKAYYMELLKYGIVSSPATYNTTSKTAPKTAFTMARDPKKKPTKIPTAEELLKKIKAKKAKVKKAPKK